MARSNSEREVSTMTKIILKNGCTIEARPDVRRSWIQRFPALQDVCPEVPDACDVCPLVGLICERNNQFSCLTESMFSGFWCEVEKAFEILPLLTAAVGMKRS